MPEDAPAEVQDTPTPEAEAPDGEAAGQPSEEPQGSEESADSFRERYEQLRPEYTRATQKLSEMERFIGYLQDPQTQAEALRALGLELEGEEPVEDEDADPTDLLASRLERLEGELATRADTEAYQEAQELEAEYVGRELDRVAKDLTEDERKLVSDLANLYRDEDDIPDVQAAYEAYQRTLEAGNKRYRESKRAPRVEVGTAGAEKFNFADDDERQEMMAAIMEAAAEAEE